MGGCAMMMPEALAFSAYWKIIRISMSEPEMPHVEMVVMAKTLLIVVSLGRTPFLYYDFSVNHCTAQIIALAL